MPEPTDPNGAPWSARLLLAALKVGSRIAGGVPEPVADRVGDALAVAASYGMPGRRAMVERHLRRAMGPQATAREVRHAARHAFASSARYWLESFRLPGLPASEVDRRFSYVGYDLVLEGLAQGKGVILALPHLGGWEWAGRWLTDRGMPPTVVVEPLRPPEVFEWFAGFRRSLGMTVVPLGPQAGSAVLRPLRDNQIVCLLSDRDLQGGGIEVEFFGERTRLPGGPATLALRSGAALLPTAVYFDGRSHHHAVVRPPLTVERTGQLRDDVTALTQHLAHELEGLVRAAPEQWHLFQPNWPSDPGYGG